ncbi:hypothetical protein C449_13192 [Halococcus saccharolyticus DSM 5350]|uniref:Uncharacterized protein n=1 Tax=Halococcus saccharolyticus DSM 5350 TaxID=1227455 RepID=M0MDY8_9EURY|nr:hypothetical protein C449_13192 [Halococcus saccharolyticus DSM 5350]
MITENELDIDGEVIDVDTDRGNSTQMKMMVPCGNGCSRCPHGPYEYQVQRDGGSLNWVYAGRSTP